MNACAFDEENGVMDPPPGFDPDDVQPLSVFRGLTEPGHPVTISCWKVTAEELADIQRTGRVWLAVIGHSVPPVAVLGSNPFKE